ncbi:DUF427 domain-containing protein [Rhodococcus sp. HNM0569]|uniref:DUF427 domain-containing protein n=1 Tax=Rhodococcus sp. HNM0569 TaxID=2716340 RepID=UPI00146B143B|nr:DUF427 domain-containing protein [Rhodococcus sp. HNM0569]NLU81824.1 DUF427 domain-containing protein [Rhodococcus sp. HNM0569]
MALEMNDAMTRLREDLRYLPLVSRIRAQVDGVVVADSIDALLVWEPGQYLPRYAIPGQDVGLSLVAANQTGDEHTTPGTSFHVAVGGRRRGTAFRPDDADLATYFVFDWDGFDWFVEDEQVLGHPRDPFHRVDVRRSSRHVRIAAPGRVLAETDRCAMLFETSFPFPRYYVPREDVAVDLIPSDTRSVCPYKGEASYWSVRVGDSLLSDIAWTYHQPLDVASGIAGHVCFYHERLDTTVAPR